MPAPTPAPTKESRHRFTLVVSGTDPDAEDFEDRLFEAGCGDATVCVTNGVVTLDFARRAKNFVHAVATAIQDVGSAGGDVVRIEPDPYVTAAEIAERAGLTRQAVSYLIQGTRGPGGFPPPTLRVTSGSPLYDWLAVARWLRKCGRITGSTRLFEAAVVQEINRSLDTGRPAGISIRNRTLIGTPAPVRPNPPDPPPGYWEP